MKQDEALEVLKTWFKSSEKLAVLSGRPGSGKTVLTGKFIEELQNTGVKILITATTNEALNQLLLKLPPNLGKLEAMTIFSALGLIVSTGSENLYLRKVKPKVDISKYGLIIVDEISFADVGDKYEKIGNYILGLNKALLVGDSAQLRPVKSAHAQSPIFKIPKVQIELTENYRQTNLSQGVLNLLENLREIADLKKQPVYNLKRDVKHTALAEDFKRTTLREFISSLSEPWRLEQLSNGELKVLCWKNTTVKSINHKIRTLLFPNDYLEELLVGDTIIFTSPFSVLPINSEKISDFLDPKFLAKALDPPSVIRTNTTAKIIAINNGSYLGHNCKLATLQLQKGADVIIPLFTEASVPEEFTNAAEYFKTLALRKEEPYKNWQIYHALKGLILNYQYGYAITVHRSQGADFNNVAVIISDLEENRNLIERAQLAYVAFSRHRKCLEAVV